MPRQPKPWYRSREDAWYTTIGGRQYLLARGKASRAAATAAFARLVVRLGQPADTTWAITLSEACEAYLSHSEAIHAAITYHGNVARLQVVVRALGANRLLTGLTAPELERFAAARPVAPDTRRAYLVALRAVWRHAQKQGWITAAWPDVRIPSPRRRERTLSVDERQRLREAARPDFRALLEVLEATGARPHVLYDLEARHVRWDEGTAVVPSKGRPYVLVLPASALARLKTLAAQHPAGPLLRNACGERWTRNAVRCRFRRLMRITGIAGVGAYTYRHSYATDALEAGMSPALVAGLLNHQDLTMLSRHYAHLTERREALRRAAEEAATAGRSPARGTTRGPQRKSGSAGRSGDNRTSHS